MFLDTSSSLTFKNNSATAGNGGAIYNNLGKTLYAQNITFIGNSATGDGGAVYGKGVGSIGTGLTLDSNRAGSYGGGIYVNSAPTLSGTIFTKNSATSGGGGLYADNSAGITLTGCTFTNNGKVGSYTTADGGAVYNNLGIMSMTGNGYTGNSVANNGGALYSSGGTITSSGNTFTNNSASNYGGAAYIIGSASFSGETFQTNSAASGGAIYNNGTITNVSDSTSFTGNSATTGSGGAIYNNTGKSITLSNSSFTNNTASNGSGGAIYNLGTVSNTDVTYTNNSATSGGAIYNNGTITVSDDTFTKNSATNGGAVYNDTSGTIANFTGTFGGSDSSYKNSASNSGGVVYNLGTIATLGGTFNYNTAVNNGGAIYNGGNITNTFNAGTIFTGNSVSSGSGGAIYNSSGIINLGDSGFTSNSATNGSGGAVYNAGTISDTSGTYTSNSASSGGAIYNIGSVTNIESGASFTKNSATSGSGGAIYNTGTITSLSGTFGGSSGDANTANVSGGAIYNSGTISSLSGTFGYNSSASGGAIYNDGTISNVNSGTTFTSNSASGNGGAIYNNSGKSISISGTIFSGNTSGASGGAIYNNSGTVTVADSTFSSNKSTSGNGGAIYNAGGTLNILANANKETSFTSNTASSASNAIYIAGGTTNLNAGSNGDIKFNDKISSSSISNQINVNGSSYPLLTTGNIIFNQNVSNVGINLYSGTLTLGETGNAPREYLTNVNLNLQGGVLNLENGSVTDTLNLNNFNSTSAASLKFDANLETHQNDKITASSISSGADLYVSGLNIVADSTTSVGLTLTLFTGGVNSPQLNSFTAYTSNYKYDFSPSSTKGVYDITRTAGSLYAAVKDDNNPRSYSATTDELVNNNLGAMGGTNSTLTIYGNNLSIIGNGTPKVGISVASGQTLNIYQVGSLSGGSVVNSWKNFSSTDGGVVNNSGTTNIYNSVFSNDTATDKGGVIYNTGVLTSDSSTYSANSALSGGAIYNSGTLTLNADTFGGNNTAAGNTATNFGGAIYNDTAGSITSSGTTFKYNSAVSGGAIYNAGNITSTGDTYSNNSASSNGGAIYNYEGTTTLTDVTMSNNTATTKGGAIYSNGGTVNINATGKAVTFSGNTENAGVTANDIYMTNGAKLNLTANNYDITLNGGIEGTGTINKLGSGNLILKGINTGFTGEYNNTAGNVIIQSAFFTGVNNFTGGTADIQAGGSLTLNSGDSWTNTNISTTGATGSLTLDGFSHTSGGTYTQNSGSLILANSSTLALTSGSTISGGSVSFTGTGNTLEIAGGTLDSSVALTLNTNNTFKVSTGSATLNSNDNWSGAGIVSLTGGSLTLDGIASNGIYNQSGGTTTLTSGTSLTLDDDSNLNGGTFVDSGTVNLTNTTSKTVSTQFSGGGIINKNAAGESTFTADNSGFTGTFNQTAGTSVIKSDFFAGINEFTGGTAEIQSGGSLTLNSGDSWTGTNMSNSGGTLSLNGFSHTSGGSYSQSGGSLYLKNTGSASSLTLTSGSTISGGTVNFVGTGNSLNVSAGASIAANTSIILNSSNTLNISGGNVTIGSDDSWSGLGTVSIASGDLVLDDVTTNGIFSQTGGNTNLKSNSTLTISNNCDLGGGTLTADGTLNLSTLTAKTVATKISGSGIINKNESGESIFTADNSGFTGTFNQTNGESIIQNKFFAGVNNFTSGDVDIQLGGSLTLNAGDTWIDTNITTSGGALTLDSFSHLYYGSLTRTYNQTSGSLTLTNTSAASYLSLGLGSSISGGTVNFTGTGNTLEIATGATFRSAATITLNNGNTLLISGGTATLNNTDVWNGTGKVNLTAGNLTLDGVTTNGIYTQTTGTGTLQIANGSTLTIGTNSEISTGTVDFVGTGNTLDITTGGLLSTNASIIVSANNLLKISGGNATLNTSGVGSGSCNGSVLLSAGTLTLDNVNAVPVSSGLFTQTGGTLKLIEGTDLTAYSSDITGGVIDISGTASTSSKLNLIYTGDATYNTNVNLLGNASLTLNTMGHTVTNTLDSLITNSGSGNIFVKDGLGTYNFDLSGSIGNKQINYGINVNNGTMGITGTNSGNLTLANPITLGAGATSATLNINAPAGGTVTVNGPISSTSTASNTNINSTGTGTVNFNNSISSTSLNLNGGTINFDNNISLTNDKLSISGGTANFVNQNFNTSNDITLTGGTMNINAGNGGASYIQDKINATSGTININNTVGTNPTDGTVYVYKPIDPLSVNLYNGSLYLSNESYLNGNDFGVYGGTLNTQNNSTGTIALNNLTFGGNANWLIDVDLANKIGDKITSANLATGVGTLNISGINLLNDANTNLAAITVADDNVKNHVTNSVNSLTSALYKYAVSYNSSGSNGVLNFVRTGISPNAVTSDVAQTQTFLLQTAMNRQLFGNVDAFMSFPLAARESTICCALSNGNTSGAACPISGNGTFSPIYSCDLNRGIWVKTFTSFENIPLQNGPNVSTVEYGTMVGMDAPLTYLKRGWVGNTSAYVGYLGSNQNYDNVGVSQDGVLVGLAENMIKGNNFLTLMASVGSSLGTSVTRWGNDYFSSIFAGAAVKGGHNFEFKGGEYIIQPNLMLAYTYTYTPTYNTASGLEMTSKPLNAMQVAPGIRLIKNLKQEKGQVYLLANFIYNLMDKTRFSANDVQLPELSIAPYIEYGIGYQRVWKERFTGFFQTVLRGGGRNGVALQFGLRWAI